MRIIYVLSLKQGHPLSSDMLSKIFRTKLNFGGFVISFGTTPGATHHLLLHALFRIQLTEGLPDTRG
jgi:hypothetical protein